MEVSGKRKDPQNDVQLYCQPCLKDGLKVPVHGYCQDCVEHLCDSCYKTHRKPAPCRNHVLLDKNQMPKTQSSGMFSVPNGLTEECALHKGKPIEYFCKNHNSYGCGPCITVNHRNCNVDYFLDVSNKYFSGDEYNLFVNSLETLTENFKEIIDGVETSKKKILQNKATIKDEIKKFRKEVDNMLDYLEAETDALFEEELDKLDTIARRYVILLKDIRDIQDRLNALERENKPTVLYMEAKANEPLVHYYTSSVETTQAKTSGNTFAFQPNWTLEEILCGSGLRMGQIHISGTESLLTDASKFTSMHTENKLQRSIQMSIQHFETLNAKKAGK